MSLNLKNIILEACVETLDEAIEAEKRGASRIELCGRLDLDGLTPDRDVIIKVLENLSIPVKVMIRPRAGNFVYTKSEMDQNFNEISWCKEVGITEIVSGILTPWGSIDLVKMEAIAKHASPMNITFHKAIDATKNVLESIDILKSIPGITSILSSGQASSAQASIPLLKEMLNACGDSLNLIIAGKVTLESLAELHGAIGAGEYHGRQIVGDLGSVGGIS